MSSLRTDNSATGAPFGGYGLFWTPFMSGYGGIRVVMLPNGPTYYYFGDNDEFSWFDAVNESNILKPMCP